MTETSAIKRGLEEQVPLGPPTTIQVKRETKFYLDKLKLVDQESYDNVIKRILSELLDSCEEGSDLKTKRLIGSRLREVELGAVISTDQLRERLREDRNEVRKGMGQIHSKRPKRAE